jgi:hypothetical protein
MRPSLTYRSNRVSYERPHLLNRWAGSTYVKNRGYLGPISLNRSRKWDGDTLDTIGYNLVQRYASPIGDIPVDQHRTKSGKVKRKDPNHKWIVVGREAWTDVKDGTFTFAEKRRRKLAPVMLEKNVLFGGSAHRGKTERADLIPDEYGFHRKPNRLSARKIARALREKDAPSGLMGVANPSDVRTTGPNSGVGQRAGRVKKARVRCSPYRWAKKVPQGDSAKVSS